MLVDDCVHSDENEVAFDELTLQFQMSYLHCISGAKGASKLTYRG